MISLSVKIIGSRPPPRRTGWLVAGSGRTPKSNLGV